jgi:hypothetical protein
MPPPPGVSSELLANPMFQNLVGVANANYPFVDIWDAAHDVPWLPTDPLFQTTPAITTDAMLTCFDAIQARLKVTLDAQTETQRITNADYAKTLIGMTQVALQGAIQFMLGKDQAYFLALKTQADALTARMQNERLRAEVMLLRAQFAVAKLSLARTDSEFGVSEYQRTEILPVQMQLAKGQTETAHAQTTDTKFYGGGSIAGQLGAQKALTEKQTGLVHEQLEGQRAQTLDARQDGVSRTYTHTNPDGTTEPRIMGLLGVQNFLYRQQINSYRDDSKIKAAKIFSDLWMTQKTVDDTTMAPDYIQPPTDLVPSNPYENVFKQIRFMVTGYGDTWTPP